MVVIRKVRKSDAEQLLKLEREFSKGTTLNRRIVSQKLLRLIRYRNYVEHWREEVNNYFKLRKRNEVLFVAEENGVLIGYACGKVISQPEKVLDKVGYVNDWFVTKKRRGKGIGKALWNKLFAWFKEKKCKCLELKVYPGNNPALKVYRKLGLIDKLIVMGKKL